MDGFLINPPLERVSLLQVALSDLKARRIVLTFTSTKFFSQIEPVSNEFSLSSSNGDTFDRKTLTFALIYLDNKKGEGKRRWSV